MSSVRAAEISALLQLLTYFLEERHLLLHLQFYAQVKEYQTKSVGNIRRSSPPFQTFLKFLAKLRCGADHLWQLGLRLVFWMNFSFLAAFAKIFNWMVIPLSDLLERRASPVRVLRAYRLQYFLALPVPC